MVNTKFDGIINQTSILALIQQPSIAQLTKLKFNIFVKATLNVIESLVGELVSP
jgi:hypothetical protein